MVFLDALSGAGFGIEPDEPSLPTTSTEGGKVSPPSESSPEGDVLDRVTGMLGRFVSYPDASALVAHGLWILHSHLLDLWESTPRIAFLSPEPSSGKTRALEITEMLVPNPVAAVNVTPAYLFRKVGDDGAKPTILFDEIDTVFGPKARDNEEIRGLLNAGHRRGAVAGRCVVKGKAIETEEIPAYAAVALAGLGDLPDTILARSVVIKMRRRGPNETVEPFRPRLHGPAGRVLRDAIKEWADQARAHLADTWPTMPDGIEDRDADIWEPLLACADAVGGDWPQRARIAAIGLVAESKKTTPSLGIRLLTDLQSVFAENDVMSTEQILAGLMALEEAPWADLRGRPLNARTLAQRLGNYGVKSKTVRIGAFTPRGYTREDLHEPWRRYVAVPPTGSDTSATSETEQTNVVAHVAHVADVMVGTLRESELDHTHPANHRTGNEGLRAECPDEAVTSNDATSSVFSFGSTKPGDADGS